MIILKILLALVGVGIIGTAIFCFFAELTEELGLIAGLVGAGIIFLVFRNEKVIEFLGVSIDLIDEIAFGSMIGGGVLCAMDFRKLGGVMITAGWIAVGLVLMQVIPIPFISNLLEIVSLPFTIACIPLLLIVLLFI